MTLAEFFKENPRIALGFSGGVDSSYLLYAAKQYAKEVTAYYVNAAFQPDHELEEAKKVAAFIGVPITVLEVDVFSSEIVLSNPADRCYHCKQVIFGLLSQLAQEAGIPLLIDGTNASDDASDRPGMRALEELSVRSPLRECGLTKAQVRTLSKEAGLSTWDKPSYACLATRIPTGMPITADLLRRVEGAEQVLFSLGFSDFRCRVYHDAARLQFTGAQLPKALALKEEIRAGLAPYFDIVLLDLAEREASI